MSKPNKVAPWIRKIENGDSAGGHAPQNQNQDKSTPNQDHNHKGENAGNDSGSGDSEESPDSDDDGGDKKQPDWKTHAKHWEKQSKQNLTALEKARRDLADKDTQIAQLTATITERDTAVHQLAILQTLISIGADAAVLSDSRSFMSKAEALDPNDDDFETNIRELVKTQKPLHNSGGQFLPEGSQSTSGTDLWDLVHGSDT